MEALVIIDMQYYFISDTLQKTFPEITLPNKIVPLIKNCLNEARQLQIPILHIKTEYKLDKSNWPKSRLHREILYCMQGTQEAEIISELQPTKNETVILKSRFSGFYNTGLEDWLKSNDINTIVLAGYALDCCVRFTAVDAFNVGLNTIILSDCVMSAQEPTKDSIKYLQFLIQSDVADSKQWLSNYYKPVVKP